MTKPKLILVGAGGHAHSCIDVIERHGHFQIAGLVGLPEQRDAQHLEYGYAVIGTDSDLSCLAKTYQYALITIGQIQSAEHRIRLYQQVRQLGYQLPIIISPTAHISSHATLGVGTIVMHGAIVNAGASVGNNCIINSRALIEHDARVEDHCHISTGAILNGDVTVGSGSFIGSGSIIKQGIVIGGDCLVGMGLGVRYDLTNNTQFTGYGKV
ncbi:NeuD/PglB/VioB family sugar acetyltransferase [Polynucleobacter sp. AM-25C3]|uniref:NeuD/PglB/VioB family sugar acetyltransferase n=1 Tax=Polynucleobacter sp. AM-25C3 TaxID=1855569 RepID=UPI001C0B816B|nr:NeuD/PglB/VioB family sugar acetyltransferase [Polynucleobacter sp. AM-25C3]MBU3601772.1 NeuD/PglB/VioB family sugar acetyltransferase [Polynucleobacter sp. AM-25C3]